MLKPPSTCSTKKEAVAARTHAANVAHDVGAVSQLHAELDGIVRRPVDDTACRQALLDCLLRCRGLVGGVWFRVQGNRVTSDISRLPGPMFQRTDITRWISNLAERTLSERSDIVALCPAMRNLKAISVPADADRRATAREGETTTTIPGRALIVFATCDQDQSDDSELLAAQCVVRAWRDWYSIQEVVQSREQLLATSALLDLSSRIVNTQDSNSACQTLVNALQCHFDARFVALALKPDRRLTGRLKAVSGIGDFDRNSQQAARLEAALNEVIIRGELTVHPAVGAEQHQNLGHKRVRETFGVDAVLSIPLTDNEGTVGAILIGGTAQKLFQEQSRSILKSASRPLGEAIRLSQQLEGGPLRKATRRIGKEVLQWRCQAVLLLFALAIAAMFVPVTYRIGCRCTVEPVLRRFSLAPYDGMLETTFVEPGDVVTQGQLVARMDGRELSWELAGLTADSERAHKERDVHMADLAVADSLMSELEMEKLSARKSLIQNRLENLEMRSPVDGIVLSGSLDRREHYPVTTGQVVYEIAPLDPLRVEVAVPAEERPHVEEGMNVEVRMDGNAGTPLVGVIKRILPRSEIRNEQNVFIAEVLVSNLDGELKPGMEGAVRISSHKRAWGWTIGHRAWERFTTKVWW